MRTPFTASAITAIILMGIASCSKPVSEPPVNKEIATPPFRYIKATGLEHFEVKKGNTPKIWARMKPSAIAMLRTRVADDTLFIDVPTQPDRMLDGYLLLEMPEMGSVTIGGEGTAFIYGFGPIGNMTLSALEKRFITANLSAGDLTVTAEREGNIVLNGEGTNLTVRTGQSARVNAFNYPVAFSRITAADKSVVSTNVSQTFHASASDTAVIYFKGFPNTRTTSERGLGKIIDFN